MKIKITKQLISVILIICMSFLWLSELTLRRAIEIADHQMMPFITSGSEFRSGHRFQWFYWIPTDTRKLPFSPGWSIFYEEVDVLSNPLSIHVSLFGKVTGTSVEELTYALSLPYGEERNKLIEKLQKKHVEIG